MRVDRCFSAVRAAEEPVVVCFRSSCSHVTGRRTVRFVRLALKGVMQNDGHFVYVILLCSSSHLITERLFARGVKRPAGDGKHYAPTIRPVLSVSET